MERGGTTTKARAPTRSRTSDVARNDARSAIRRRLEMWTRSREPRQRGHTKDMILAVRRWSVREPVMSLRAGDLISTDHGGVRPRHEHPRRYLQPGDVSSMGITKLGCRETESSKSEVASPSEHLRRDGPLDAPRTDCGGEPALGRAVSSGDSNAAEQWFLPFTPCPLGYSRYRGRLREAATRCGRSDMRRSRVLACRALLRRNGARSRRKPKLSTGPSRGSCTT